jgi:predicted alpha/beta-hydrolase family hydrolase
MNASVEPVSLQVAVSETVSALLLVPEATRAAFVFAHGAGAGMNHTFMAALASGLAARSIASLRFQFPYMQKGLRRPDAPALAQVTVRAAVGEALRRLPTTPLFAGGKSFGGRMTSQAQAEAPLTGVLGLVFVGFPLHPEGRPSTQRAEHLARIGIPMLFLQGTRDALADLHLLRPVVAELGDRASLAVFEHADHAFHVPVKSGSSGEVLEALADTMSGWMFEVSGQSRGDPAATR